MPKLVTLFLATALLAVPAGQALAAVWYVDGDTPSSGNGTSWGTAFQTITEAIANPTTVAGDQIWVKQGTYALAATIDVNKAVEIYGGFMGTESTLEQRDWSGRETILDGQDSVRSLYVTAAAAIDGFTITRGNGSYGGGVQVSGAAAAITNCTLSHNKATAYGGGIYNSSSDTAIFNCTLYDNRSDSGGAGIANSNSVPTLTNCTFYENYAPLGGALRNSDSSPTVTNCIIWANYNTEIADYGTSSPSFTYCDIRADGYAGNNGNIRQDPRFVDPENGDLHLQSVSACVDAGTNAAGLPATDRNGDTRIADGDNDGSPVVDMGADEVIIWFVDGAAGTDPADCSGGHSWAAAYQTIGKAAACARAGHEIWVKAGQYTLASSVYLTKIVHLFGGFSGSETARGQRNWITHPTTVNGNDTVRCFYVSHDATLDGFTITRGYNNASGGGIYCDQCSPRFKNCTFTDNNAPSGAAVFNQSSAPIVDRCRFLENSASLDGGGMYNHDASSAVITSCLFIGNSAGDDGGAVHNAQSSPTITGCSFAGNSAAYNGGAIFNYDGSDAVVANSILWGDIALSGAEEIYNSSSAPAVTYCDIDQNGYAGSNGNIRQDPLFVDVSSPDKSDWDLHLQSASPCIDVGDNGAAALPEADFEGDPRIIDGDRNHIGVTDMGADEYRPVAAGSHLQLLLMD